MQCCQKGKQARRKGAKVKEPHGFQHLHTVEVFSLLLVETLQIQQARLGKGKP